MSEGYVDFAVNMGKWKTIFRHDVNNDLTNFADAMSLAHPLEGVDAVLEEALRTILDLSQVDAALGEGNNSNAGEMFTIVSSRKFGKLLNELTEKNEWQAKEKKMIQELIRLYASRKIMRNAGWELNYGLPPKTFNTGKMSEGTIQFIANYDAWKCIKKFRVTTEMNRRTLAEFIVSYAITLDLKLETYLPRVLNMKEIDAYVKKSPGKSASVEELIQFLSHNELQTIIQKISSSVSPDMRSRCELVLKAYVARKVLNPKGLIVEPLQVKNLPGWKRVVGKRK